MTLSISSPELDKVIFCESRLVFRLSNTRFSEYELRRISITDFSDFNDALSEETPTEDYTLQKKKFP